jgi:hypothetical protein
LRDAIEIVGAFRNDEGRLRNTEFLQCPARRYLVLNATKRFELGHHGRYIEIRAHCREHCDLLLGWEEHIDVSPMGDGASSLEPGEGRPSKWRHKMDSLHVPRESRQTDPARRENLDFMSEIAESSSDLSRCEPGAF